MNPREFSELLDGGATQAVRVEYLIVYRKPEDDADILHLLLDRLSDALDANQNVFDTETIARMLTPDVQRIAFAPTGEPLQDAATLYGFILELPAETARPENVVEEFTAALSKTPPITHAVKFYDSLLLRHNARLAEELFELEMKLRRVLSIIYLHRSPMKPYELLCDDVEKPVTPEKLTPEHLSAAVENELFHLTFGQYPKLNQRKLPGKIAEIVPIVREALSFELFREELRRLPVENEDDQLFISGLKEALGTVFTVRNCIAHNRSVPRKTLENYERIAKPALEKLLKEYMEQWTIEQAEFDIPTERARNVIERAMAEAEWDETAKIVTVNDPEGHVHAFRNRDELEKWLCDLAETEWCGHAPRIDGDYVGLLDKASLVSEILEPHGEQLDKIFGEVE